MEEIIKKKRGRKPKNFYTHHQETEEVIQEKKKRGRKKKYEIENSERLNNREHINNFDHHVVYSDDEEVNTELNIKNVSFGSLNITVSKKVNNTSMDDYRKQIIENSKKTNIEEDEYSDEDILIVENKNLHFEKHYSEPEKYIPEPNTNKEQSLKKLRVVTTLKNVIKEEEWPSETDVCCWWCCHQFEGPPCTLPTKYDPLRKRFTFNGIFCSWNCTKAYNFQRNDHKQFERSSLISLLVRELYSMEEAISIKQAPSRQCLKMFGGYMTIEEFRNTFSNAGSYQINLVKNNFIYPEVTEITNVKSKLEKKNLRLSRA